MSALQAHNDSRVKSAPNRVISHDFLRRLAVAAATRRPEESFCEMVPLIERFIILVSKDGMEGNGE